MIFRIQIIIFQLFYLASGPNIWKDLSRVNQHLIDFRFAMAIKCWNTDWHSEVSRWLNQQSPSINQAEFNWKAIRINERSEQRKKRLEISFMDTRNPHLEGKTGARWLDRTNSEPERPLINNNWKASESISHFQSHYNFILSGCTNIWETKSKRRINLW